MTSMATNGDIGSFEYYLTRRLTHLEEDGLSKDTVNSLRERGAKITAELVAFRATRQQLAASGRLTPQGLADDVSQAAAKAAGEIKRHADDTILREDIRRTKGKLTAKAAPDPTEKLYKLLQHQEIRRELEARGISGSDTLTADNAYREAAFRGDHATMEALETWPMGSPVSPALIAEGQAQRLDAIDPINAAKLSELQVFQDALAQTWRDAMTELRPMLPVDDPIARLAQGETGDDAA
jgi:hypothetical protein